MTLAEVAPAAAAAAAPTPAALPAATSIVLVAHGSPDARHAASVRRTATRLAGLTGTPVTPAFLEHDSPTVAETLALDPPVDLTLRPGHMIVLPLLLTAGFHWHSDLPPVLSHHGRTARLLAPPEPVRFAADIAALAVGGSHLVLASAGSSRPEIHDRFAGLAHTLRVVHGVPEVSVALNPAAVARQARPGSVVVPVLTADGIFADRIRAAATTKGADTSAVLGDTAGFAARLAELL